jgi:GNAT superfamily N-acetyltransferase
VIFIIRRATNFDKDAITNIWANCFTEDSERFINVFLSNCFAFDRCLIWKQDGKPVAMLHLLPQIIKTHNRDYKTQYLYAAATLPEYRSQGIMRKLMLAAEQDGIKYGYEYTVLLPATQSLYQFYEANGFSTAFNVKKAQVSRKELLNISYGNFTLLLKSQNNNSAARLRYKYYNNAVICTDELSAYISQEWILNGGKILQFDEGFIYYIEKGVEVHVKELCGSKLLLKSMLATLLQNTIGEHFYFYLSPSVDIFSKVENKKIAMIKPIAQMDENIKTLIQNDILSINMMLD